MVIIKRDIKEITWLFIVHHSVATFVQCSVYWSCLCVHFIIRRSLLGWYLWFFISLQLVFKDRTKKNQVRKWKLKSSCVKTEFNKYNFRINEICCFVLFEGLHVLIGFQLWKDGQIKYKINFLYVRSTRLKSNIFGEKQIHWFYLLKYWQSNEIINTNKCNKHTGWTQS